MTDAGVTAAHLHQGHSPRMAAGTVISVWPSPSRLSPSPRVSKTWLMPRPLISEW